MTTPLAPSAAPLRQRTGFGVILNLIGLVAVLSYLIPAVGRGAPAIPALTLPLSMLALVAWLASMLLPLERTALLRLCGLLMVLGGAGAAWDTDGVLVVPVIIGVMQLASWDTRPWIAVAAAAASGGLIAGTAVLGLALTGSQPGFGELVSLEAGVLIALLAGTNRREVRARDAEAREAIRQAAVAREEQNRAQTLADRQQLAREIHDVLAHSLGGLVIQLDAAEAQFEAGAVDTVLARLRDARAMAADGLTEARHAVEALRTDPGAASPGDRAPSVNGQQVAAAIAELAEAHTRLGSAVMLRSEGDASALSERTATALRRAAQESLSNARKHAPDAPVRMELVWSAGTVELSVRNPLEAENRTSRLAGSGSGRGIAGMRERFATIPGGSVEAGPIADEFVVRVTASTEGAAR